MRARDPGIEIGLGRPGPLDAITDVAGVRVGVVTLIEGEAGPLVVGEGPVRTGVTVIVPHDGGRVRPLPRPAARAAARKGRLVAWRSFTRWPTGGYA